MMLIKNVLNLTTTTTVNFMQTFMLYARMKLNFYNIKNFYDIGISKALIFIFIINAKCICLFYVRNCADHYLSSILDNVLCNPLLNFNFVKNLWNLLAKF